ncbi:hypothetical protein [Staphylococcus xylosus]
MPQLSLGTNFITCCYMNVNVKETTIKLPKPTKQELTCPISNHDIGYIISNYKVEVDTINQIL